MAITSYPFDDQDTTEAQYSTLFRELQDSGVVDSIGGTGFQVTADATGMQVKVQPGVAIVRGHVVVSTAVETLPIDAASAALRTDRVVLRLDPTANTITLEVVTGTSGAGLPALTQTDTGIYELPLGRVPVSPGDVTIGVGVPVDERWYVGSRVGHWTTDTRPSSPRKHRIGINTATGQWETWNGSAWVELEMAPKAHTHDWATDITGKPATYAPSAHTHDWTEVTGKPTSFTPSGHTHSPAHIISDGSVRLSMAVIPTGTSMASVALGNHTHGTSSIRYKEHVRDHELAPDGVLALRPRMYDRKPTVEHGEVHPGAVDEYGLIAEEVHELVPELVEYDQEGQVHGVRYDRLGVALIPIVRSLLERVEELEARLAGGGG